MKKVLGTGGTVFVSRALAEYFVREGWEVYVLNRNTKEQPRGVHLIEADRYRLGEAIRGLFVDVVIDTSYTAQEVNLLLDALGGCREYILISSSAVYPENLVQPFREEMPTGENVYWRKYGTDKIEAEEVLRKRKPDAYIIRPPYLYGPMNDIYREGFVFDCAMADRDFYLPKDGSMGLQFFHIQDLCRFIGILLTKRPSRCIFNVGNPEMVSIREWVELCYRVAGKTPRFVPVREPVEQSRYFSFRDYEYRLDVSRQCELMPDTKPLLEGLEESFAWYRNHQEFVEKRPYLEYIDQHFRKTAETGGEA